MYQEVVYDDLTGQILQYEHVVRKMGVWQTVPLSQCWERAGRKPIRGRWADANKKGQVESRSGSDGLTPTRKTTSATTTDRGMVHKKYDRLTEAPIEKPFRGNASDRGTETGDLAGGDCKQHGRDQQETIVHGRLEGVSPCRCD